MSSTRGGARLAGDPKDFIIVTDASPWGGGGFLLERGCHTEYFATSWPQSLRIGSMKVVAGLPKFQPFWEAVVVLQALILWASGRGRQPFAVLSDCLAALAATAGQKGKGAITAVIREVAWRSARQQWNIFVGHLPSEANLVADALPRLEAPLAAAFPKELEQARRRTPLSVECLWFALPERGQPVSADVS